MSRENHQTQSRNSPDETPTYVVHDESLALPEDEAGWIRAKLDGEVWRGGVQPLGATVPRVLPQNVGRDLVTVVDGQDVTAAQVQASGAERKGGFS